MSSVKDEIQKVIKEKRPKLSDSSLRTYVSLISSLVNKFKESDLKFLNNDFEKVKTHIVSLEKPQSRKTLCSALFVLTDDNRYKELMMDDIKIVNNLYKDQHPEPDTETKPYSEILLIHHELVGKLKKNPSRENYVNLIISYLSSGVLPELPPRRIMDYSLMKLLKDKDEKNENYIDKNTFVFNKYKTASLYNEQRINIPKELMALINKWKKVNDTNLLLVTEKNEPFTTSSLSRRVTSIFGVTMDKLRSIYLSHIYKDIPPLLQMEETARKMGHSVSSALNYYVKKVSD